MPGASWNGSRFLSRSSTATCCELSMNKFTPVLKTEASIRFKNIFHLGIGIVLRLCIKQVEQKINKNSWYQKDVSGDMLNPVAT